MSYRDTYIKSIKKINNDLSLNIKGISKIDEKTNLRDIKIFEDSLNTVMFFSILEEQLKIDHGLNLTIEYEKFDFESDIKNLGDLMKSILKSIK